MNNAGKLFLEAQRSFARRIMSEILGLSEEEQQAILEPERIIQVKISFRTSDGRLLVTQAWRSQHNSALGPYKGGIRFHPMASMEETIALSMIMTWKNSLLELPYGGAKGAVKIDPKKLSSKDLEILSREYVRGIFRYIGPWMDIPAPDVYTNPQIMSWMLDEYQRLAQQLHPGAFTGKPEILGGIAVRLESTGFGAAIVTREVANRLLGGLEAKRVLIHGFGNAGYYAAKYLSSFGAKIVGVADSKGAVYNEKGLDVEKLKEVKARTGTVANYPEAKKLDSMELLEQDADILIPASIENIITSENASQVKAKLIVEIANGPITPDAEKILLSKGAIIIPDILANAGGVVASHLEWAHNLTGCIYQDDQLRKMVEEKMISATNRVLVAKDSRELESYRDAAYALAIERVYKAMKLRGRL
jgi:glutamate dehydrogenase (NAD(P)+)